MKVSVAIITCKRPAALLRLLHSLDQLTTSAELELVVVDNDSTQTAGPSLAAYSGKHRLVTVHEPISGIPYARNAALKACSTNSDYIAFLDDDEEVTPNWLTEILRTISTTGADAAGGPVVPLYPSDTSDWIIKGRFFEREQKQDGQTCRMLATNNCLINAHNWREAPLWFDTRLQYTGSSDTLFFMMARKAGWRFVWAAHAEVREHIPQQRLNAAWIIQRQYRIGNGLSFCDVLAHGYMRAVPIRIAKALAHGLIGFMHLLRYPSDRQAAWVKARASWARAAGGVAGLCGSRYEEYAPYRLVKETA